MSRFVSAGTSEDNAAEKDDEWIKVQRELEANRDRKVQPGAQEGGKSLYEVLQANKGASFYTESRPRAASRDMADNDIFCLLQTLSRKHSRNRFV